MDREIYPARVPHYEGYPDGKHPVEWPFWSGSIDRSVRAFAAGAGLFGGEAPEFMEAAQRCMVYARADARYLPHIAAVAFHLACARWVKERPFDQIPPSPIGWDPEDPSKGLWYGAGRSFIRLEPDPGRPGYGRLYVGCEQWSSSGLLDGEESAEDRQRAAEQALR